MRAEGRTQLTGVLSFQHVGPEHQTLGLRLGGRSFTHWLISSAQEIYLFKNNSLVCIILPFIEDEGQFSPMCLSVLTMLQDQILAECLTLQDVETPAFPRADQYLDFIINTENVALHKS